MHKLWSNWVKYSGNSFLHLNLLPQSYQTWGRWLDNFCRFLQPLRQKILTAVTYGRSVKVRYFYYQTLISSQSRYLHSITIKTWAIERHYRERYHNQIPKFAQSKTWHSDGNAVREITNYLQHTSKRRCSKSA